MLPLDLLKKGDILPFLKLPEVSGGTVTFSKFRGRRSLVLLLTHSADCALCAEKLQELHEALDQLRSEDAEVMAIVPGPPQQGMELQRRLALAFPVLNDDGRLPSDHAVLVVTDRFGEIFAIWRAGQEHRLPTVAEIAGELAFIALQCPE